MRKRLRKKLHRGEYTVYGFAVVFALHAHVTAEERNAFFDRFIRDAIEGHGLLYGGSEEGFAVSEQDSTTEEQRLAVQRWLEAAREVATVTIGPLQDANRG